MFLRISSVFWRDYSGVANLICNMRAKTEEQTVDGQPFRGIRFHARSLRFPRVKKQRYAIYEDASVLQN